MAELDHGLKIIARESGRALARIAGFPCRTWKPSESSVQSTTERLADRVFIASQAKERFVVYFEFVTTWHSSVPWSVLGKSGMLAERERLPVASLIFVLQPKGYVPQNGTMQLKIGRQPAQQVWFHEERLWEIEPESWWEREPGLMALYPLCRHREKPNESILHAAERIEHNESDTAVRADLLTSLGIAGRLAYPGLDALSLIGREKMKESKAYQEILAEGREEGRAGGQRRTVLALVAQRFGKKAASAVSDSLSSIDNADELDHLALIASSCGEVDELRRAMPHIAKKR